MNCLYIYIYIYILLTVFKPREIHSFIHGDRTFSSVSVNHVISYLPYLWRCPSLLLPGQLRHMAKEKPTANQLASSVTRYRSRLLIVLEPRQVDFYRQVGSRKPLRATGSYCTLIIASSMVKTHSTVKVCPPPPPCLDSMLPVPEGLFEKLDDLRWLDHTRQTR